MTPAKGRLNANNTLNYLLQNSVEPPPNYLWRDTDYESIDLVAGGPEMENSIQHSASRQETPS
ncbi:MAG: hypothetical protein FJ295_17125 [Planctomycetes bacterium]|nr:hypothetical protein [Planctomycetota bacterium]